MDVEEVIAELEPVIAIVEPVVEPEQIYTYQPTDENGRKLGGKQVIKYKTQNELIQKMTDQNVQLVRKLREETKKQRLGLVDNENIPTDAPRFDLPLEFNQRQLTPEERVQLSRDLLDPERSEQATDTMFEAAIGVKPDVLRTTLSRLSQNDMRVLAKTESDAFMASTPEYYPCMDNFTTLTSWMVKNDLAPVRQNFIMAYNKLKEGGLMLDAPSVNTVVPETVDEPIVPTREVILDPVVPTVPVVTAPAAVPLASGLTRSQGGDVPPPPAKSKYTLSQINVMTGEEYKKKLLHEKGFAQIVENLEKEAAENKRNRRQG